MEGKGKGEKHARDRSVGPKNNPVRGNDDYLNGGLRWGADSGERWEWVRSGAGGGTGETLGAARVWGKSQEYQEPFQGSDSDDP